MLFRLEVTHHLDPAVMRLLLRIEGHLVAMTEATDNLAREVSETRDAVNALTGRYQAKIDTLQTKINELQAAIDAEDPAAIQAAATALDELQTEMAALAPADPTPPADTDTPAA